MDAVDFAIDMETLGRHSGCVVLSIGLVVFNPYTDEIIEKYYWEPDIEKQFRDGLTVEADTLAWWATKEDPEERKILKNYIDTGEEDVDNKPNLKDVLLQIIHVYHEYSTDDTDKFSRLWCVGPDFDIAMLRYLYNKFDDEEGYPFHYQAARDLRTFCDALGIDRDEVEMADGLKKHNALDDAIHCANIIQYGYSNRKVEL